MDYLSIDVYGLLIMFIVSVIIALYIYKRYVRLNVTIEKAKKIKTVWQFILILDVVILIILLAFFFIYFPNSYHLIHPIFITLWCTYLPLFMYVSINRYIICKYFDELKKTEEKEKD